MVLVQQNCSVRLLQQRGGFVGGQFRVHGGQRQLKRHFLVVAQKGEPVRQRVAQLREFDFPDGLAEEGWLRDDALEFRKLLVVQRLGRSEDTGDFFPDGRGVLVGLLHQPSFLSLSPAFSLHDFVVDDAPHGGHVVEKEGVFEEVALCADCELLAVVLEVAVECLGAAGVQIVQVV